MSEADGVWQLVRGHELLVELVVTGRDFPWLNAKVRPAAGFAEVRPLFDDELRQLEFIDDELEQWEAAYRRIREVVRLLAPDGPGQCLSSCFTSKMRTPGGDGVMSPSQRRAASSDNLGWVGRTARFPQFAGPFPNTASRQTAYVEFHINGCMSKTRLC